MSVQRVKLSMCAFNDGTFSLYIIDPNTHEEIEISGTRRFSDKEHEFFLRLMPACVWTTYEREVI